jgi:hypothetical protein
MFIFMFFLSFLGPLFGKDTLTGAEVFATDGVVVGGTTGMRDGAVFKEGAVEATTDGTLEGKPDGELSKEGVIEATTEGIVEGKLDGESLKEGVNEATTEGFLDGKLDGESLKEGDALPMGGTAKTVRPLK